MAVPVPLGVIILPKEHGSWSLAFEPVALAALALARSIPAVLTVRCYLHVRKGLRGNWAPAVGAAILAAAGLAGLARAGLVPGFAAAWAGLLLARTIWLVSPWRPEWPARRLGMTEAIIGAAYCGSLGLG